MIDLTVSVSMGSWAERYTGVRDTKLTLNDGSTVSDALKLLQLPAEEVGMTSVNMTIVGKDSVLRDGDLLKVLPPIIGG